MKKLLKSNFLLLLMVLSISSLAQSSANVFLQPEYWRANPTLADIQKSVREGNDPLAFNDRKFNGVVYAVLNENVSLEAIKYLIELDGHNINNLTHDGRTYIHWAAMRGRTSLVKYLNEQGVKLDVVDDHGYSVLNFAANAGRTEKELYEYVLSNGSSLGETNHHGASTILLLTPNLENYEMVEYMLSKGASLDATDQDGNGLFYYTARKGNIQMMELLIEKGLTYKEFNKKGANAMIAAASGGRRANGLEVFKYLESKGVKVNVTTDDGTTPLTAIAASTDDPAVINYFVSKGVDINQADKDGNTPLMMAASRNNLEMVKLVESKSDKINASNKDGQSALTMAVSGNKAEVVQYLLDEGAKAKISDANGNNLAYYVVKSYSPRSAEDFEKKVTILESKGVDFQASQEKGNTLLHLATEENDLYLVKKVAALRVDVNQANSEGVTPLQIAAMKASDDQILKFLIAEGADKTVKTDFDESVYDLASENELLTVNDVDIDFLKL